MANTKEVRADCEHQKHAKLSLWWLQLVRLKNTNEMQFGRPYSEKIKEVISHIANSSSEYSHPFMNREKLRKRFWW